CVLKQEELAERVGKNRSTVTNYLRLLRLPEEIQIALRDNQISMGHARPLINLEDKEAQLDILDQIIDHELSVRSVEDLIRKRTTPGKKTNKEKEIIPRLVQEDNLQVWEHKFSRLYSAHVKMKVNKKGRGELIIPFTSETDLKRLASLLESKN
ncbi:MAG: chromosome partitioning protein ParB, partial [Bacteroidota bacterium]|nr:chromosome partitioning protein ParB [Bacteroidota bacterium]